MPGIDKTLIMKFGGASVRTPECFSKIADLIIYQSQFYPRLVVVVSAMGDMTDQLISLAHAVHHSPPRREYDMLVSVGERISISLLAMALAAKGKVAKSFTGSQTGIITTEDHAEAKIIDVRPFRLIPHLQAGHCAIVAGFQGVSEKEKEITTLGRGGSDTTAVALGIALGAEKVEFYKDVDGIYEEDPTISPGAQLFSELNYDEAFKIISKPNGEILHPRALLLAQLNGIPLHVKSFFDFRKQGTRIFSHNPPTQRVVYEQGELLSLNQARY